MRDTWAPRREDSAQGAPLRPTARRARLAAVTEPRSEPLVGIFVGGRARRMGGIAKGLLPAPDGAGPLVLRASGLAQTLALRVVLVGEHPAYAALGLPMIADAAADAGPLGGLVALLEHARGEDVIALACDLPYLDGTLLARLAHERPDAAILAPRRDGRWEPLAARYGAGVLPSARRRLDARELALQALLAEVGATELPLDAATLPTLDDWDTPADLRGHSSSRKPPKSQGS
jgi:molybdopterin-guanine dinucleotide biosynthesis protein A